jgi:hypothetical protein
MNSIWTLRVPPPPPEFSHQCDDHSTRRSVTKLIPLLERSMPAHNFQVGEIVHLSPFISRNVSGGSSEVIKQLPEHSGELQCRIKSMNKPQERIVRESELRKS